MYEKADLLAWIRANKVSLTAEEAVRKGQLFSSSADLARVEAFWTDAHGQVIGTVEEAPVKKVTERLGQFDIQWLPIADAGVRMWSALTSHRFFADAVLNVSRHAHRSMEAGIEATKLAAESLLALLTLPAAARGARAVL